MLMSLWTYFSISKFIKISAWRCFTNLFQCFIDLYNRWVSHVLSTNSHNNHYKKPKTIFFGLILVTLQLCPCSTRSFYLLLSVVSSLRAAFLSWTLVLPTPLPPQLRSQHPLLPTYSSSLSTSLLPRSFPDRVFWPHLSLIPISGSSTRYIISLSSLHFFSQF